MTNYTADAMTAPDETELPGDQQLQRRSSWFAVLRGQDFIVALGIGALTVATWPLFALPPGRPLLIPLVAHVCGMLAGYGVLVLLIFVARSPILERDLGADVLARWHARGGRIVVGLVLVHASFAILSWAQGRNQGLAVSSWQVIRMPWIPAATLGTLLMLVIAATSMRRARRRLRHEEWHGLHLLMYVAIALGFGHQLAGPDLVHHRVLQVLWALAYTEVFALVIRYRLLVPVRQAARHRMRVTGVHHEGPDMVSILIEGEHLDELHAEAGQFFRWRFLTPDHWSNAHPFSLSALPRSNQFRLTVKALGDGSRSLQNLPVGTWVIVEGPYGAITAARRARRNVLLIAGGVGITPMRSLFEALPVAPGDDLLLLYRARKSEELVFREELDEIATARGARVAYLLGKDRNILSAAALTANVPDLPQREVYMCGPPGLTEAVAKALKQAGLPRSQLHEEHFDF